MNADPEETGKQYAGVFSNFEKLFKKNGVAPTTNLIYFPVLSEKDKPEIQFGCIGATGKKTPGAYRVVLEQTTAGLKYIGMMGHPGDVECGPGKKGCFRECGE
jgi:hypothetical protein